MSSHGADNARPVTCRHAVVGPTFDADGTEQHRPYPVADLAQGKVWKTDDVDHWIHEHRPEPT